jgi:hypothetical protein
LSLSSSDESSITSFFFAAFAFACSGLCRFAAGVEAARGDFERRAPPPPPPPPIDGPALVP